MNGDNGFRDKMVNATRLGFPLPLVIMVVAGFLYGYIHFDTREDRIAEKIGEMRELIIRNAGNITRNTVDPRHAWRRWDMALWCARAEKANPGFKCPDAYGQPAARRRPGQ